MTPLLLASMPSSGSDWFAACMQRALPQLVAPRDVEPEQSQVKEWFNPLCNPCVPQLGQYFACEAMHTVPNLLRPLRRYELDAVLWQWPRKATFTKDNFIAAQLPTLRERVDVVALVRDTADTFPSERLRVVSWYVAIACGLRGGAAWAISPRDSMYDVARAAHREYRSLLESNLTRPAINWRTLVFGTEHEVHAEITAALPHRLADSAYAIASQVLTSREMRGRSELRSKGAEPAAEQQQEAEQSVCE